ncbi:MAG: hypothetical protein ACREXT_08790 [Gammaproteobacteria bacterium]
MANQSSQVITDLDATPVVRLNQIKDGARVKEKIAVLAMTTGAAADIKRFVRVPSRARIGAVLMRNTDLDSNGTPTLATDIGLYRTAADGGAVVDADFFASAITQLQAAVVNFTDVTYESGVVTAANSGKRIWEALALAADPGVDYDVALTYTTGAATHANGDVAVKVQYVVDE